MTVHFGVARQYDAIATQQRDPDAPMRTDRAVEVSEVFDIKRAGNDAEQCSIRPADASGEIDCPVAGDTAPDRQADEQLATRSSECSELLDRLLKAPRDLERPAGVA